jgi:ATP-binding protein involved in chromosome partitioning
VLSRALDADVPLLGRIPFDVRLREGGDAGMPLVLADPAAPAAEVLRSVAQRLGKRPRGLSGMSLGLTPASRF